MRKIILILEDSEYREYEEINEKSKTEHIDIYRKGLKTAKGEK